MSVYQKYQNKKVAVYGMGITGCSAAKTIKNLNAQALCWDDNAKIRKKAKKLNYQINKFWLSNEKIDAIVVSPGIDIRKCKIRDYLKKNFNKIITDLDLFFELNKNSMIISITGTNGKSTTCKIIEKILKTKKYKVKTVGNIGNPILSLNKPDKKCIYILEVSSYQLEYSKLFRSKHAAILNISPDHLERHKSLKNYIKIKSKIFLAQNSSDYSYINSKNKYSKSIINIFKTKKLKSKLISLNMTLYNSLLKNVNNAYFKSPGNIENLVFAIKIAKKFKIKNKIIIKALNQFKGLPHRQEIIFSNKRLLCINDSKATSFDAAFQSLSNYNNIYWILGGIPKYQDNFKLLNFKKKILKAYIIGKHSSFFEKKIKKHVPYTVSHNIKNALKSINEDLKFRKKIKSTILLSPAAASFDQFNNFENRGLYFKKLIFKNVKQRLYA